MKKTSAVLLFTLLAGCSQDYPDRHIAKCELEWHAAPDHVQDSWVSNDQAFVRGCMSADDFAFDWGNQKCATDAYSSECYQSRQSIAFWFKKHLK